MLLCRLCSSFSLSFYFLRIYFASKQKKYLIFGFAKTNKTKQNKKNLQGLLDRGARYVVVQGLPLTGCLTMAMSLARPEDRDNVSCVASLNRQSYAHNRRLLAALHQLRRSHPDAVIAYADYYAAHLAVMRSPAAYGFTEPFRACCGSGGGDYNFDLFATCGSPAVNTSCAQPARYVNWDGVHMTEAMYKVVAGMFFHAGDAYCRPAFSDLLARKAQGKP
jgi:phospholipase/lecithinase/hemolysin